MKYIRTTDGIVIKAKPIEYDLVDEDDTFIQHRRDYVDIFNKKQYVQERIVKEADTLEEFIQIGDIVFYWSPSDDKEHCVVINYDTEIDSIKYNVITKLLIPVGEDYKCVAKGNPSFNLIGNKRYLANKGELKLL